MSRSPVRGFDRSNGHGRRQPGAEVVSRQSNLMVESAARGARSAPAPDADRRGEAPEQALRPLLPRRHRRLHHHRPRRRAGLQGDSGGGLPRLPRRPPGRTGARRRHRGHAAGELRQDPGHLRQARGLQRLLRRRIRQRAGVGGLARAAGFRNRNREESQVAGPAAAAAPAGGSARDERRADEDAVRRCACCVLGWPLRPAPPPAAADDPMLQAMRDELERSRTLIKVAGPGAALLHRVRPRRRPTTFPSPPAWAALVSARRERFRVPDVQVRVGDYKFDNTNYVGSGFAFGSRYDVDRFPLDDLYPAAAPLPLAGDRHARTRPPSRPSRASAPRCATSPQRASSTISPTPSRSSCWTRSRARQLDEAAWSARVRAALRASSTATRS